MLKSTGLVAGVVIPSGMKMSDQSPPVGDSKGVEVIYYLMHKEPATAKEIAESTGIKPGMVQKTLREFWRGEYLVRRERHAGHGDNPYEYAINVDQELLDNEQETSNV